MAAHWEAVAWGHRNFKAEDIMELELTMVISALWFIRFAITKDSSKEIYQMIGEWRDKITRVRFAINPVTENSKIDHAKMIEMIREVANEIRTVTRLSPEYATLLVDQRNSLMGIVAAFQNLYFGEAKQ
jgi:hypothetical protein